MYVYMYVSNSYMHIAEDDERWSWSLEMRLKKKEWKKLFWGNKNVEIKKYQPSIPEELNYM